MICRILSFLGLDLDPRTSLPKTRQQGYSLLDLESGQIQGGKLRFTRYETRANFQTSRFAQLMDLYEQNYLLTRLLVPDLRKLELGEHTSRAQGCLPLYLNVLEKEKYTTTLCLSYRFREKKAQYPKQPDLIVRVYHDASTAEAMKGLIHGQRYTRRMSRTLRESWKLNRFLYKWLRYCLHRGHLFEARYFELKKLG
jgi:uncharacterized protein YqiB (DUF1249 family)